MEYLTDDWFTAANAVLAELNLAPGTVVIEQRVTGSGGQEYQLVIADGEASLDRAVNRTPDVVMSQSVDTAVAVRSGSLTALEAVQTGRISIEGDPRRLIECAELLSIVD
ncbi:MAG: SCP2 sterol-binding domain-containing protein, partial [Actinomycetota bacterium]|nr:SCP2 sterol-binding domain-containing protein [Actinomycetota bacterium]